GEKLQRKAIALLPNHHQQRFTASILRNLEHEISRYVLTISVINALVGLIFSVLLLLLSIPLQEALLWGTVVALLNFAPYVGPLIGVLLMLLIGLVQFHESSRALLPALLYLMLHTLEGQLITPIILGHRMAISPLMLIVALLLFGSLWGLIGLLLAVPMLVCIKMVLSRIEDLQRWSRLLE
ncbi:MAG TPA: AI-2E family transporter, partial [Xylella fastidiosa subsp. multiplex]